MLCVCCLCLLLSLFVKVVLLQFLVRVLGCVVCFCSFAWLVVVFFCFACLPFNVRFFATLANKVGLLLEVPMGQASKPAPNRALV